MKYGIAIFPSKTLQDIANSLRARYDSHYAQIPPHITLKEAFEATDVNVLAKEIKKITKEIKPFSINVYKFSSFNPVSNTIYMGIQENEELLTLQKKLNSGFFEQELKHQFIPHITVGQDLDDDEFHDVLGRLRMKTINHEEVCDRIQLLYQLDNGSWTVYETFLLGKDY
jgi:2'-5' RNA ligase